MSGLHPNQDAMHFEQGERLSAAKMNTLAEAANAKYRQSSGGSVGQPLPIVGKLDGPLVAATAFATAPGTAVMSVWIRNSSGDLVDSGRNETVVTRLENINTIASGTIVYAMWIEGEWTVFIADC